jgi:predicted O-methyltransferase YrrM
MNIEKALRVPGWMSPPELEWLAEQAHHSDLIAEIGCWMGRSTRAMADATDGAIVAIDTWEGSAENQDELKDKAPDYLFQEFNTNLADHLRTGHVVAMRGSSLSAAAAFAMQKKRFDMVFIDAAHDYASVKADILAWLPLVITGGLICGHDYDWGWPGVVHAVRELISPTPNQAAGGSSIWYKQL